MTSVNDNCIKCKLMDCMEVCPVDCFYEGENMLAIKPDCCRCNIKKASNLIKYKMNNIKQDVPQTRKMARFN